MESKNVGRPFLLPRRIAFPLVASSLFLLMCSVEYLFIFFVQGLKIIDFGQPDFIRILEQAIQLGKPVVLKNVGEALDPALNPIIVRAFVKLGENETSVIAIGYYNKYSDTC